MIDKVGYRLWRCREIVFYGFFYFVYFVSRGFCFGLFFKDILWRIVTEERDRCVFFR